MSDGQADRLSPGIIRAEGVFETMRVQNGKVIFLKEHFNRLGRGLKVFKIRMPYSRKRMKEDIVRLLKSNRLKTASVRLMIFREKNKVRISIICRPVGTFRYQRGFKAMVAAQRRNKTRTSHIKSVDYQIFHKAWQQANKNGFDEAVLLNGRGELVEGSRTNLFFVKNNILMTPSIQCGCLRGITRRVVMQRARELKVVCKTVKAKLIQLQNADEAFLTNSILGIMPLTKLGEQDISLHGACSIYLQW